MVTAQLAVAPSSPSKRLRACMPPTAAASATHVNVPQRRAAATATSTVATATAVVVPAGGAARADVHAATPSLARMWREVQGANDWRGLVEPLHPLLRDEVVRYGELVAACYRALDLDRRSKRYLNCKHGKAQILPAVGMADAGYRVTKYIYAAPDVTLPMGVCGPCSKSRWIGYVAVASDSEAGRLGRRDILVSFRGTVTGSEWLANFMSLLSPARFDPVDPRPDVRVESGFLSLYTSDNDTSRFTTGSCRNQLLSEISGLINKYKHEEISITLAGHSMGSSLAILLGYDLAELGMNQNVHSGTIPVTVFSFGGPRVGNLEFKNRCDEMGVKVLRVVNVNDPVTRMPGMLFNENARVLGGRYEMPWSKACYAHVGIEVALDFFKAGDLACVHDLQEAYINQLLECSKDVAIASMVSRDDGEVVRDRVGTMSMLESWRWQMAVIRAGELLLALGI